MVGKDVAHKRSFSVPAPRGRDPKEASAGLNSGGRFSDFPAERQKSRWAGHDRRISRRARVHPGPLL